jgi:ArsR family transcriptional regulator
LDTPWTLGHCPQALTREAIDEDELRHWQTPVGGVLMTIDTGWFNCASMCVNMASPMSTHLAALPSRPLISLPVLDCAPLLSGAPLDDQAAAQLAALLRVLADPGRLRILSLIHAQPTREACVCHLTDALGLSQPTVSHHLRVLFGAGLLGRERRGNWVYYRAVPGVLAGLRDALTGDAARAAATSAGDCSASCACP